MIFKVVLVALPTSAFVSRSLLAAHVPRASRTGCVTPRYAHARSPKWRVLRRALTNRGDYRSGGKTRTVYSTVPELSENEFPGSGFGFALFLSLSLPLGAGVAGFAAG